MYSNTAQVGPNVYVHDNGQLTVSYLVDLTGVEGSVTVLPAPPPFPPQPPPASPPPMICLDTCGTAGDTVCQDGGWKAFGSMCAFGTDCSDCGSRLLIDPPPSPPVFPPPPPPTPQPPPPSLPPGATNEIVSAKEVTLVLKAVGTVEEYEAKADSVKESLRQELRCFLPTCVFTVTVEAGSVILTVVATDTAGAASQVESAAVALRAKPLNAMSSVLGITIEELPAAPSVVAVQFQVMRLAPTPPPPSPDVGVPSPAPPPLPDVGSKATSDPGATQDAGPGLAIGLALGGCLLAAVLAAAVFVWHRKRRMQPPTGSSTRAPQQVEVTVAQPDSQKV